MSLLKKEAFGPLFLCLRFCQRRRGGNRCIAALLTFRGNALPLFWHCRFAAAGKALIYGLLALGTRLALSRLRKIWSKVSRHEHQLR
ncbi:hypothetical protein [Pseudomonas chlororaphis]|uniref:hypothetical protein n=1 Tax=Pseudomonas chlororaphis TaxID=587753 RepID=UPI000F76647C|nr:hypothetical protein [Pseudomonas chlororaphis]MBM0280950.1 hypothetical protein [Pseudomonas chlororaphis]MDO1503306.1 hypothetical protein [Pseudomonas chlororaphis]TWR97054.1 hypothetical protein FJD36_08290 [Pseudomonas chlororaphis subsp. chlororaphis]WDG96350.1 hypothetical protein PUP54_21650 [Pseudomonas chlororaphis]WDH15220.1 hypothetical protein PUP70_24155 [Pseudomonas chlororaphis]